MSYSFANFSDDAGVRLHTATTSIPGIFSRPGMCRLLTIFPAPMIPIRIVCSPILDFSNFEVKAEVQGAGIKKT